MKLKIKRERLLTGINTAMKGISSKNLLPILSGIKLELNKKGLSLISSDNDIVVKTEIEYDKDIMTIEREGTIIVKGSFFREIVSKLDDEFIEIERVDGLKIVISAENSTIDLNGYEEKDYPNITFDLNKEYILLGEQELKETISQISFACSQDDQRQVLKGINFKTNKDKLECVATDSFRLAKKTLKLDEVFKDNINITIPGDNLVKLASLLQESDDNINMHVYNNKIIFEKRNLLFQTRLINGNYPEVNNLFETKEDFSIYLNRSSFYNVIDRASIFTSSKDKNIITLQTELDNILIKSSSYEIGKTEEKMEAKKTDDTKDIRISFSAIYMKESISAYKDDIIKLSFTGSEKPIVIESDDNKSLIQLVLPIRDY